jgi:predicted phage terminase large subunit-like protein
MWEWANDASVRWFFASYDQKLSTRDSVKCRDLIASPLYQALWGHKFTIDEDQKTYYVTDKGGYRLATSVGGHGTGEHPDRIVVDDPNNVQGSESDVERQSVLDWWDRTMATRGVARNARRVIIMQRLHQSDLSGHVLAKGDYVHICLPMRYEKNRLKPTPLGWTDPRRQEGELLAPKQFDEAKVAEQEKNLGAYGTAGQLQQRPAPLGGGMFKASYFTKRPKGAPYKAERVRFWDRAASPGKGCWTCGVLMSKDDEGYYVEHVVRGQWEPGERDKMILATAQRDRARYGPRHEPRIFIEREPGSSGIDSIQFITRKLAGFSVFADLPTGSKEVRAEPYASQCAALNVSLVEDGTWDTQAYIDELCAFPNGTYCDQVDASSGAFGKLVKSTRPSLLRTFNLASRKDKTRRIVICSRAQLEHVEVEQPAVLVSITDPGPESTLPPHALTKLLGSVVLQFPDIEPADYQDKWDQPVPPYDKLPADLIMNRAHGKSLWSTLTRNRSEHPEVLVIHDDGGNDKRALSVALAVRSLWWGTITRIGHEDWEPGPKEAPPNRHVFEMTKSCRSLVV